MDANLLFVTAMFVVFIMLLFSGFPLAFVLGGVAVIFAFAGEAWNLWLVDYFDDWVDADLRYLRFIVNRVFGIMSNYGFVPVPMFIFMGYMLDKSEIAKELLRALQLSLGSLPGGLALAVTAIGVVLAASTGIIGASVVLLTALALPTMLREGYNPSLASGTVAASGTLGILLPPSIMLILMADQMNLSVGDLFMGAVFPGLILAGLYAIYIVAVAIIKPSYAPAVPKSERTMPMRQILVMLSKSLVPPVTLIFMVLGSIFFGVASPSEAAGVGAAGATILAALRGKLSMTTMKDVCFATAKTTAFIAAVLIGATAFAVVLRGLGGDEVIKGGILAIPFEPTGILITLLLIIFMLGFFLDWIEITLIVLPLMVLALPALGIDPLWFTILVAVTLQTSFLTPPVGFAIFYMKSAAPPGVTLYDIYKGIIPFVMLQMLGLLIVGMFPGTVSWLPSVAYN